MYSELFDWLQTKWFWISLLIVTVLVVAIILIVRYVGQDKNVANPTSPPESTQLTGVVTTMLQARKRPLRIMTIGDSTVQGFGPNSIDYNDYFLKIYQ